MKHVLDPVQIVGLNKMAYDQLSVEYGQSFEKRLPLNRWLVEVYVNELKSISGKAKPKVLDIGCAVGIDALSLSELGCEVLGMDVSEKMVEVARFKVPNVNFKVGDFYKESFSEKFDGVFAQNFIHLFPKNVAVELVKKMADLLADHGLIHLTTSDENKSTEGLFSKETYKGDVIRYRKFWDFEEFRNVLESLGLVVQNSFYTLPFGGSPWMVFHVTKR